MRVCERHRFVLCFLKNHKNGKNSEIILLDKSNSLIAMFSETIISVARYLKNLISF